jgi:hypothetical protein
MNTALGWLRLTSPVLVITVLVAIWLYLRPSRGARELEASRDAVRHATNWHSVRSIRLSDGSWFVNGMRDVVCPTDFDETSIHPERNPATERRVELQGYFYHQLPNGLWQRMGNGLIKIPDCGRGPYLEFFEHIYADLDEIERNGEVFPGGNLDSDGVKCQWWHITTTNPKEPKYSVCLEANSHLPLVATSLTYGFSYSFSEWNRTAITAPTPNDAPP